MSLFGNNNNKQNNSVINNNQSQRQQLLNVFSPLIFFMNSSSLTFKRDAANSTKQSDVIVNSGYLPDNLMAELLTIEKRITESDRMLKEIEKVPLPGIDKLESLAEEMDKNLRVVSGHIESKEPLISQLLKESKMNIRHSERILHETRRVNNNYNLKTVGNAGGTQSRFIAAKAIPSEYFQQVLMTLEKHLLQNKRSVGKIEELLRAAMTEKENVKNFSTEGIDKLKALLFQQYQSFLQTASTIARLNKQVDALRNSHSLKFGTDFDEIEHIEKRRKEKKRMTLLENTQTSNLNGVVANMFNSSNNPNQQNNQQNNQQTTSLFASTQQTSNQTPSLFGNTQANSNQTPSLFGSTPQKTNQTSSLFGNNQQTTNQTPSLFGNTQKTQQTPSLFGNTQKQATNSSLFGSTSSGGLFGK